MNENNTPTQVSQLSEKKIYSIGLHRIRPMQNHPFSVRDDEEMTALKKIIRTGSAHLTIPEEADKIKGEEYDPTVGRGSG